jgi:pyruvate,water dikinase
MGYVLGLGQIDRHQVAIAGGKGAQLGELLRVDGVVVPDGFCVTTDAFRQTLTGVPAIDEQFERLAGLEPEDREWIGSLSAEIRRTIEAIPIPDDVASAITAALDGLGAHVAYAVRSSATAEDLPTASFAGQHDTYLDVIGPEAILRDISRCWASLFTERAVTYRMRNGVDHREVLMAVVVQQMVVPKVSGVLFTADPVTGNRRVTSVEAVVGLGEALVSGLVDPDVYNVRDGDVVETSTEAEPALSDAQAVELAQLGRRIEAHFGCPQDVEWCLVDDEVFVVQSRPITTLFPIPARDDRENHVYVSVGHGQMMTDAMKPLGYSMWQQTAMVPMHEAGGRLFVDVTMALASPTGRAGLLEVMGRGDPLIRDALQTVLDRGDFVPALPDAGPAGPPPGAAAAPTPIATDPAIIAGLVERSEASIAALRRDIRAASGPARFDFLLEAFGEHKRVLGDPLSMQAIMAGMQATWWLDDQLQDWLGEKRAVDTLTLSAPGNVTSEMGLALLDVADVIRPHREVVEFLQDVVDDRFLDELPKLPGGQVAHDAIQAYLGRYGMRCVGEIDITRPRWSERPTTLVPPILDNVRLFEPGAARRRLEQGQQAAAAKERDVLERLRTLPDGDRKAADTKAMIDRVRTFSGYREYPKYAIITRYSIYKQALLEEIERLVEAGELLDVEDGFFLTFPELHDAVRTNHVDPELISRRRDEFRSNQALTPPRVLTSDGEAVAGSYRRDGVPPGSLVGVAVSAGTVEGRARVILDMAEADLDAGDILVTAHADPSWSPLFVATAGLVTEVGGLMTHGSVIAREYGLPAVVGVEHATELIRDGQRIRVHGTEGYVEILP